MGHFKARWSYLEALKTERVKDLTAIELFAAVHHHKNHLNDIRF